MTEPEEVDSVALVEAPSDNRRELTGYSSWPLPNVGLNPLAFHGFRPTVYSTFIPEKEFHKRPNLPKWQHNLVPSSLYKPQWVPHQMTPQMPRNKNRSVNKEKNANGKRRQLNRRLEESSITRSPVAIGLWRTAGRGRHSR